jgi:hypothetical protein
MTITEIIASIDQRLATIRTEVKHLEVARTALVNEPHRAAPPKPRRVRRKPAQPAYQVVPGGKLSALLAGSDGMSTRQLAKATNGNPAQVLALLKEQESADHLRRTGTRAATRWHVITDEDRIAARAAELERQTRRTRARKS